ncbi:hypothetical protein ECZU17_07790 [Escherichia coli]|nr:hypothetical protein ECZU17_07790 [Escherichia coli]
MLMAGIQFTAGEHEFQLFHQQRKGLVQMVRIRVAEPASDTGAVCKVMQPVTLQTRRAPKQGVTVQGSPHQGRSLLLSGCVVPGSVSDTIKSSQKIS